jgi:hypothetical protein
VPYAFVEGNLIGSFKDGRFEMGRGDAKDSDGRHGMFSESLFEVEDSGRGPEGEVGRRS